MADLMQNISNFERPKEKIMDDGKYGKALRNFDEGSILFWRGVFEY